MNVLYLNTHDIGCFLEPYGYHVETPNLMELAKDGLTFRNMFCACPTCSPSRGALVTGCYPHNNGLIGLSHRGFRIENKDHHIASYLAAHGYETVLSGVQHEIKLREEEKLGYQKILNPEAYYRRDMRQEELLTWQDELAGANAVAYLKERKQGDKPFFLAVGFGCTHRDYPDVPEDYDTAYIQPPKRIPDTPESRRDMAGFHIALKTVDRLCGDILNALKETGEYENTLIMFTTDHGVAFPAVKCNLYDDGMKVAFLMTWPGMKKKRAAVDALLSQIDVFPTICEILGTGIPDWVQGRSFLPVLEGERAEIRDAVFGELNYHVAYEPVRCIRTKHFKYIRRGECGYVHPMPVHIDDSASKEIFHDNGYFETVRPQEELYDLILDPQEMVNQADNPDFKDILADLKNRLERWQRETSDPLLSGKVELPEGAIACTPDSYSTRSQVILPECRKCLDDLKDVLQNAIK